MITLPHTGLRVPTVGIGVTYVTQDTAEGAPYTSAVLQEGRKVLGVITSDGFRPGSFVGTDRARTLVERFADQCRDRNGDPLPRAEVYTRLLVEAVYARQVSKAEADGVPLIRLFTDRGTVEVCRLDAGRPIDSATALAVCQRMSFPGDVVRVELWTGPAQEWAKVLSRPKATDS
jgi:hypothetical protein